MGTRRHITDYLIILTSGMVYCLVFFYRGSLSPIVDVLEDEFHTTSSGIGLMSSLFWAGYFALQLPSGLMLEVLTAEFITLIGAMGLCITSFLFSLSTNITYASIILCVSGMLVSSGFLAMISLIAQKLGNNSIPVWNGSIFFFTFCFLLTMNTLQSYLWDNHGIWRETYYVLSGLCLLFAVIFILFNICNKNYYNKYNQRIFIEESMTKTYREMDTLSDIDHDIPRYDADEIALLSPIREYQSFICVPIYRKRDNLSSLSSKCSLLKIACCNHWNYIIGVYIFCISSITLAFNGLWLVLFLMTKYEYTRPVASIVSNLFYISSGFGSVLLGKLSTKYKRKKIFMIIASIMCGCSVLIIYLPSTMHIAVIIALNCISGVGCGVLPICFAISREYNEYYNCSDVAGGIVNTIGTSAGFLVQFAVGLLIDINWDKRNGEEDEDGDRIYIDKDYEFAFIIIPVVIGLSLILALTIKETYGDTLQHKQKNDRCVSHGHTKSTLEQW